MKLTNRSGYLQKQRFHYDFIGGCNSFGDWQKVIDDYDQWVKRQKIYSFIPKKIHQIWIGGNIPKELEDFTLSWKVKMPEYEYHLWTEEEILTLESPLMSLFAKSRNPGVKSDIARYIILYEQGGIYMDTDFECVKNMESCLIGSTFICGQSPANEKGNIQYLNGLIASTPKHPIIEMAIKALSEVNRVDESDAMRIIASTGPGLLTSSINHIERSPDIGCLPSNYFYPWPGFMSDNSLDYKKYYTETTYAVHHWKCSWFKWIDYEKLSLKGKLKFKIRALLQSFNIV